MQYTDIPSKEQIAICRVEKQVSAKAAHHDIGHPESVTVVTFLQVLRR